jgi:diguanylate cyclase (GGDEF)-like protein/PAS domain S-box-containing protein
MSALRRDDDYRDIIESIPCIILRCDPAGMVSFINRSGLRVLGVDHEGAKGKGVIDLFAPSAPAGHDLARAIESVIASPSESVTLETSWPRPDGTATCCSWTVQGIQDARDELIGILSVGMEVDRHQGLSRSLEESERTFTELAENLEQCVWIKVPSTAQTGRMAYVSPAFEQIFGVPPEYFYGDPDRLFEMVYPEDLPQFKRSIEAQFERRYDVEYRVVRPDGEVRWIWSRAAPVCDAEGRIIKLVGVTEDITPRKTAENRIKELNIRLERMYKREQELSRTDNLTGLGNRQRYDEEVDRFWRQTQRSAQKADQSRYLAMILIDVDHFKEVNDTFGHAAGDTCLKAVASILKRCVRDVDVSTRPGGDEFAVLLPDTSLSEAKRVAERICGQLRQQPVTHTGEDGGVANLELSASVGVAVADGLDPTMSADLLYVRADEALYRAKQAGRGQVVS